MKYDAFISYSHDDSEVAGDLQLALHRLGRKFGRRFAVRVFRDATDLAANPDLWGRVVEGLHASRWLLVVLSSNSARSDWVNRELTEWLTLRGPSHLLIAVADGAISWDKDSGRLDPQRSSVAPPALCVKGSLPTEPTYVTVSGLERDLGSPGYRQAILMLSAAIQGTIPADIDSTDLREHRRVRRLRKWALLVLSFLTTIALVSATTAVLQAAEASRQRDEARSLALAAASEREVGRNSALGLALAYESARITPNASTEALAALVEARMAFAQPGQVIGGAIDLSGGDVTGLAFSKQTGQLWASSAKQVRAVDLGAGAGARVYRGAEYSYAVAATADGAFVAAAGTGSGAGAYVWRASDGAVIASMLRGTNVWDVAFSPDGSLLAAVDNDGFLTVWQTPGWKSTFRHKVSLSVTAVAFSNSGDEIAVGGYDNSVVRFSVPGFARVGSPMDAPGCGNGCGISQLAYSPNDEMLVSGSLDSRIYRWDTRSSQLDGDPLEGHTAGVEGISINADGSRLVSTSEDGYFLLWDLQSSQLVGRSAKPLVADPTAVAFNPNGRTFVVGMSDGSISIFDDLSGQPVYQEVPSTKESDGPLAVSGDGTRIAVAGSPIRCWDPASESEIGPGVTPSTETTAAAFSRDGQRLFLGGGTGDVGSWEVETGRALGTRSGNGSRVRGLEVSPDSRTLAVSHDDGTVQLLDADLLELRTTIHAHRGWVMAMGFVEQGELLATAGDGTLKLWKTLTGESDGTLIGRAATFSTNGTQLVSNDGNGGVSVWEFPTRRLVLSLKNSPAGVGKLAVNGDGSLWASIFRDELTLWDGRNGRQIGPGITDQPWSVLFLPNGTGFVSLDTNRGVLVWSPLWSPDGACEEVSAYVTRAQVTQIFSDDWSPRCAYQR